MARPLAFDFGVHRSFSFLGASGVGRSRPERFSWPLRCSSSWARGCLGLSQSLTQCQQGSNDVHVLDAATVLHVRGMGAGLYCTFFVRDASSPSRTCPFALVGLVGSRRSRRHCRWHLGDAEFNGEIMAPRRRQRSRGTGGTNVVALDACREVPDVPGAGSLTWAPARLRHATIHASLMAPRDLSPRTTLRCP